MSNSMWKPVNVTDSNILEVEKIIVNVFFTSISKSPQLLLFLSILSLLLIATGVYLLKLEKLSNAEETG